MLYTYVHIHIITAIAKTQTYGHLNHPKLNFFPSCWVCFRRINAVITEVQQPSVIKADLGSSTHVVLAIRFFDISICIYS
ncbi:unnamed protein product [Haemonchus placei]|uniref:Secreted protein n=1 Tax=Haemonchus placei TaxID=6290 RepID=A0A0N4WLI7_HAEPC|nr:unnamed protein product [Haemonchus placei]